MHPMSWRPHLLGRSLAGLSPGERACLAILGVVAATLAVRAAAGAGLRDDLLLHLGLAAGYVVLLAVLVRLREARWTATARPLLVVAVMFTLYFTLATAPFKAIPWVADAALAKLDRALFLGVSPTLRMEAWTTPGRLELLSFGYAFFIPYVYLSIVVGLLGRPERERDEFFNGLALLYAMGFLGYLFVPARGPIVELAGQFQAPLAGGFFHRTVVDAVARCGGPHGAFPSLHVAVSLYVCAFDLRTNPLRGLVYVPIVTLIAVATVALRYHYVVDLAGGALLTWAATQTWAAARLRARP